MLIKIIINKFINFQALLFCKYFDKNLDKQPKPKKNKREDIAAPNPKLYF